MPKRPASHQLEDVSKAKFRALLPPAWVVREKSHDYGTDLEIEVFTDKGDATGLVFLVQLRATDDLKSRQKLTLALDQLDYFHSLDLPTAIVRYCRADDSFHWVWSGNTRGSDVDADQKTITVQFSDRDAWSPESSGAIETTLRTLRLVKNYPSTGQIFLRTHNSSASYQKGYDLDAAVHAIAQATACLSDRTAVLPQSLVVDIRITDIHLRVGIDTLSSFTIELDAFDAQSLATSILYALANLLSFHQLTRQADTLARAILNRGIRLKHRFLGFHAAVALSSNAVLSARLAILNDIHTVHDGFYSGYVSYLLVGPNDPNERWEAVSLFYGAAMLSANADGTPTTEAAVSYSVGNFFRVAESYSLAIGMFNKARKLRPEYLKTDYFLNELGATFFSKAKYACAAEAYRRAASFGKTARLALYLGDALLFSGRPKEAQAEYAFAGEAEDDVTLHAEAVLKTSFCDWLIEKVGQTVPTRRYECGRILEENEPFTTIENPLFRRLFQEVDTFDEFCNFNMGASEGNKRNFSDALGHFLICALKKSREANYWVEAIRSAFFMGDHQVTLAVISTAISLGGREAYVRFREGIVAVTADERVIADFDRIYRELSDAINASKHNSVTVRALSEGKYDWVQVCTAAADGPADNERS